MYVTQYNNQSEKQNLNYMNLHQDIECFQLLFTHCIFMIIFFVNQPRRYYDAREKASKLFLNNVFFPRNSVRTYGVTNM